MLPKVLVIIDIVERTSIEYFLVGMVKIKVTKSWKVDWPVKLFSDCSDLIFKQFVLINAYFHASATKLTKYFGVGIYMGA